MKKDTRLLWVFRGFFSAIALAILVFCAWRYFAVSGTLTLAQNFNTDDDSIISIFIPHNRAGDILQNLRTGQTAQSIIEAPVYLTARLPRAFDSVTATIQYTTDYPGPVAFGVVELSTPLAVKEVLIDVPLVRDAIAAHWKTVVDDATGTTVYSQNGESFADIQKRAAAGDPVAVVNTDLQVPYRDLDYEPGKAQYKIPYTLRGGHTFAVYVKNETLFFSADLIDQNSSGGPDPVSLILLNEKNEVLHNEKFIDDGNQEANREVAAPKNIVLEKTNLPEGVYQIVLQGTNDILVQNITTAQEKFVAKDRVTFGKRDESASLQIGSDFIAAQTGNPTSLQDIRVGGSILKLHQNETPVRLDDLRTDATATMPISMSFGDVTLSFSGYAAFFDQSYFDPDFAIQAVQATTKLTDVTAIVTKDVTLPIENYRGREAQIELPLSGVLTDRKNLQFTLSAPELLSQKDVIEVDSVKFTFHRVSLWSRMTNRFFH